MQWLHDKDPQLFRTPANNGVTPMQTAAFAGQLEAIQWLYDKDPELINNNSSISQSPLELAERNKQDAAVNWLLARGAQKKKSSGCLII